MQGDLYQRILLPLFALLFFPSIAPSGICGELGPISKSDVVQVLWLNEQLLRTGHAEFSIRRLLTDPDKIPDIERALELSGRPPDALSRYIETDDSTKSYVWWGSGEMQRLDRLVDRGAEKAIGRTLAYDGNIVRTLDFTAEGKVFASIDSVETSHWLDTNRQHPYSLFKEYQNVPYSTLLENTEEYTITAPTRESGQLLQIKFRHPEISFRYFTISLDDHYRLRERLVEQKLDPESGGSTEPVERHVFGEYELMGTESGNAVWIPRKTNFHYYVGVSVDGIPVEFVQEILSIDNMEVNIDVPLDVFQVPIPKDAEVYDGLSGFGWTRKKIFAADALIEEVYEILKVTDEDSADVTAKASQALSGTNDKSIGAASLVHAPPRRVAFALQDAVFIVVGILLFCGGIAWIVVMQFQKKRQS